MYLKLFYLLMFVMLMFTNGFNFDGQSFVLYYQKHNKVRTGDLGGYATSDEFTRAVIANLA